MKDRFKSIGDQEFQADLKEWSRVHGIDAPVTWPTFEVSFERELFSFYVLYCGASASLPLDMDNQCKELTQTLTPNPV